MSPLSGFIKPRRYRGLRFSVLCGVFILLSAVARGSSTGLSGIEIKKVGSPVIIIGKTSLRQTAEGLELRGHVLRNSGHEDTTHSHLIVKLYDANGRELHEMQVEFKPRQIPHRLRILGSAQFELLVGPLPKALQRIEILAYDDSPAFPIPAPTP